MTESANEKIINKIRNLMELANDKNDEESQSALLLAQKLMAKHKVEEKDLQDLKSVQEVLESNLFDYRSKVPWHELKLAYIISNNFLVQAFTSKKFSHWSTKAKAMHNETIVFVGFPEDVELAESLYNLALEAMLHHNWKYIARYYDGIARDRKLTNNLKKSYLTGFLNGLDDKFEEQRKYLQKSTALVIQTPKEVDAYMQEKYGKLKTREIKTSPKDELDVNAFVTGLRDGRSIDFTKSTLDDAF